MTEFNNQCDGQIAYSTIEDLLKRKYNGVYPFKIRDIAWPRDEYFVVVARSPKGVFIGWDHDGRPLNFRGVNEVWVPYLEPVTTYQLYQVVFRRSDNCGAGYWIPGVLFRSEQDARNAYPEFGFIKLLPDAIEITES